MKKLFGSKWAKIEMANALVVIAILVVAYMVFLKPSVPAQSGTGSGSSGGQAPAANTVTIVGAPCTQATTLTGSVIRRYTDVAQTAQNTTIYQNGVLKGTIAHGGTTTVQSGVNGDTLDLYVAFDRSATFYSRHLRGKIETCTGSATSGDPVFKDIPVSEDLGDGVKLGKALGYSDFPNKVLQMDTTASGTLFSIVNDGQANQNNGYAGGGGNLTIGTGSSGSVTVTFRPGYNLAIGPNGNVLACQFTQAVYDSVAPISVSIDGVGTLEETGTKPSTINYPLINANNTVRAFALPGVDGRVTPVQTWHMTFRASSNNNPQNNGLDSINCTIFDSNHYTRQRDGKVVIDIENRDTNDNLGLGGTGVVVNTNPEPSFVVAVA